MSPQRTKQKQFRPAPNAVGSGVGQPATLPAHDTISENFVSENHPDAAPSPAVTGHNDSHSSTTGSERITLWLRRADQLLLGFLLISLLVLLVAFRWKLSEAGRAEIEIVSQQPREYFYAIDVNRASWVEWAQLDGIGEKLARRIVQDRDEHGPFRSVDEVGRVRGLGPKLIEKLRPFLKCRDD